MNGRTLTTLVAALVTGGLYATGCSSGSGGGGSGSTAGGIAPGRSSLTTGLPAPQYSNYQYSEVAVSQIAGGRVTALAAAPVSTAVYMGNYPTGSVSVVNDTTVSFSGNLFYSPTSMAADGAAAFAATGSPDFNGGGDVYENSGTGWSIAIDSTDNQAAVGVVGNDRLFGGTTVYAAHNSARGSGTILRRDATGQWTSIAACNSTIPTAIGGSEGRAFVGGYDAFGGGARLVRLDRDATTGQITPVTVRLPASGRVTGMVSIATVVSGSIMPVVSECMIVAVGSFDNNGLGTGGALIATDGNNRFETMATYGGDAPVAVLFQDLTVVVVTSRGRLYHRLVDGRWAEEQLPAGIAAVDCAISREATSVVLGCRTTVGAKLVRRVGGGVVQSRDRYYRPDVKAILQNRCASCHVAPGIPAAVTAMGLSLQTANDAADHTTVRNRVDLNTPAASLLLQKATGTITHQGGAVITNTSGDYVALLEWIQQGARFEAAAPPPPATLNYVTNIRPIMMDCVSCHNTATNFRLSTNLSLNQNDHAEVLQEINLGTPDASRILSKMRGVSHGGGQRYAQGSPQYMTMLQWIQQGARFQ